MVTTSGKKLRSRSPYPYIPDEVLFFNILNVLPIKPIVRFKCVSKHWKAVIEDPKFIQSHSSHTKQKSRSSLVGLFQVKHNGTKQRGSDYFFISKESLGRFHIQTSKWTCIVGISNGLLCIRSRYGFEICNPGTCEFLYLTLPQPPPLHCCTCYGFGYDRVKNEYKIVQIVQGNENFFRCMVYTLGSSKELWKDITAKSHLSSYLSCYYLDESVGLGSVMNPDRAVYSKGALHWFISDANMIISFDVHYEKFALIRGPINTGYFPKETRKTFFITKWHGCMCLGYQVHPRNSVRLFKYAREENHQFEHCYSDSHIWIDLIISIPDMPTKSRTGCLGDESRLLYWFGEGHLSLYSPDRDEGWHDYSPDNEARERFPLPPGVDESLITEYEFMHHTDNPLSLKTLLHSGLNQIGCSESNNLVLVTSVSSL